jgi:sugar phosphate isomerase/epimerase
MDEFRNVRKKFDDAGILLYAYNYSFRDDYTDEEIARGFEMANALGVKILPRRRRSLWLTASTAKPARTRSAWVFMATRTPNIPTSFIARDVREGMAGHSPYINVNLDIGHFFAAGFDPIDFINKHHERIAHCTSKIVRKTTVRTCRSARRHAHQASPAVAVDEEIPHPREYRI